MDLDGQGRFTACIIPANDTLFTISERSVLALLLKYTGPLLLTLLDTWSAYTLSRGGPLLDLRRHKSREASFEFLVTSRERRVRFNMLLWHLLIITEPCASCIHD